MKELHANHKQLAILNAMYNSTANFLVAVMGRGSGKTFELAKYCYCCVRDLPRSNGGLVGQTADTLKQTTVAVIEEVWNKHFGLKEHISDKEPGHYVKYKRPPHWWKKPHQKIEKYDDVISFPNGSVIQLISIFKKNKERGLTNDWLALDEMAFLNNEVLTKVVLPRLRGPVERYNNNLHNSLLGVTSAPQDVQGLFVYDYEQYAITNPEQYFFIEGTVYDNIDVLGEDYIDRQKMIQPPHVWDVEFMNKRLVRMPNCFYEGLDDETQLYDIVTFADDPYYNRNKPLEISVDFNKNFESCTVGQTQTDGFTFLKEFFAKKGGLPALAKMILKFYKELDHSNKKIILRGDRGGSIKQKNSNKSFFQELKDELEKQKNKRTGWTVEIHPETKRNYPGHRSKHNLINKLFRGGYGLPKIRFSRQGCYYTIKSMKFAPAKSDYTKDKSSEKKTSLPQEEATHLSDTVDYQLYYRYIHLIDAGNSSSGNLVFVGRANSRN